MGPPAGAHVDVRFRTAYLLGSWTRGAWRVSARVEGFENEDRDGVAEPGQESGWAVTAAAFWTPSQALRLGAEYLELRAQRPAAAFSGADPNTDARRAVLELRVRF
jgi:phosphate-selective porin